MNRHRMPNGLSKRAKKQEQNNAQESRPLDGTSLHPIMQLHQTIGNRAVGKMIQAKLKLGPGNDKYEIEADRVAKKIAGSSGSTYQQEDKTSKGHGDEPVRLKAAGTDAGIESIDSGVESDIQIAKGGGRALSDNVRKQMERSFHADFKGIRIHDDAHSDMLNRSLQARAFTTGPDIFFKKNEYQPGSTAGKELIAHELTHVMQQNAASQLAATSGTKIQKKKQATGSNSNKDLIQRDFDEITDPQNQTLGGDLTEYKATTTQGTWTVGVKSDPKKGYGIRSHIRFKKAGTLASGEQIKLYQVLSRLRGGVNDVTQGKLTGGFKSFGSHRARDARSGNIDVPRAEIPASQFPFGDTSKIDEPTVFSYIDKFQSDTDPAYGVGQNFGWTTGQKFGGVSDNSGSGLNVPRDVAAMGDYPSIGKVDLYAPVMRSDNETWSTIKDRSDLTSSNARKSGQWFETAALS